MQWIAEILTGKYRVAALQVVPVLAGVFALALVCDLFLLGGALALFASGERFLMRAFFAGCGRNFARLVRLGVVSLVFYGAAAVEWVCVSSVGDSIWGEGLRAAPLHYWSWLSAAAGLGLIGVVNLWFDYARIFVVADESPRVWPAIKQGRAFLFAHWGAAVRLYAGVWCAGGLLLAAYLALAWMLGAPAAIAVTLLFFVRQCASLAKSAWRLLFYSAQTALAHSSIPRPPAFPPLHM